MPRLLTDQHVILGGRIAYGVHGAGVPVVLIHGTPSHSFEWRDIVPQLTAAGHQVYVYDLLGYGQSERPIEMDTSVAGQGPVLEALLDHWSLDGPHIVGHDIGGAIALRLALSRPERIASLTVIDTVSYDSWPSETWRQIIRDHLADYAALPEDDFRALLTRQLRMTVHDQSRMTGDTLEAYLAPHTGPLGRASFFYHQVRHYDSRYTQEISHRLKDLLLPVQILWGQEDQWQPTSYAERLAADIPNAELHIIPEAGHFVMEDAPGTVGDHLTQFLKRHQETSKV